MKKVFKFLIIIVSLFVVIFLIFKSREYIDAQTEFKLTQNSFILDYVGIPVDGGLASSNNYYEIDLDRKIIDYRYDFEYWDIPANNWFRKTFGNKKRKLEQRYHISESIVSELNNLFNEITNNKKIAKEIPMDSFKYYLLKTNNGDYIIEDNNEIDSIKQILNKIKINTCRFW